MISSNILAAPSVPESTILLSYRHSFHAGNFADIIKHVVLVDILDYLIKKDSPFEYIDTHAGAGLYDLRSSNAQKLEEHESGIALLSEQQFPELARYFEIIRSFNAGDTVRFYPGSPSIANYFLRRQDRGWLFELHPQDYPLLCKNMQGNKKVRVQCQDGLAGMLSLLPPTSRRGLVLIDPSYEVKSEYDQVINAVVKGYRKFATGVYAIWYPVVDRQKINSMAQQLKKSGIKNIQQFELGVTADSSERGMTASGMFVINPPWTLMEKISAVLPRLAKVLGDNNHHSTCEILVGE